MYTHTDVAGQIYVSLYAPLSPLAEFQADNSLDPLEDLAPWVPAEASYRGQRVSDSLLLQVPPAEMDKAVLEAYNTHVATVTSPTRARDPRIAVHPDAIRLASTGLGCVFTVEYVDGDHRTFRVSRGDKGNKPLFGAVLTGHYNDDPFNYTYIGIVTEPDLSVRLTAGSKPIAAHVWPKLQDALIAIRTGQTSVDISAIDNSGKCSRCGRMLTTPQSLRDSIGPECRTKGAES